MKLFKTLLLTILLIVTVTASVAASPYSLPYGTTGNTTSLITVTNPSVAKTATASNTFTVSGYGKNGVSVTLYKLSGSTYYKTGYEWTIGASGLFFKQIELYANKNSYLCYAESGDLCQGVPFEINSINNISIKVDPNTIFGK